MRLICLQYQLEPTENEETPELEQVNLGSVYLILEKDCFIEY